MPSRRTRDVDDVSTAWQIDAYRFEIPLRHAPVRRGRLPGDRGRASGELGGLGVLNAEGLWTRYEDPSRAAGRARRRSPRTADGPRDLQEVYAEPVGPDLIAERGRASARRAASPSRSGCRRSTPRELAPVVLAAGSTCWSSRARSSPPSTSRATGEPLNLKEFIADLDVPVIVGGCRRLPDRACT